MGVVASFSPCIVSGFSKALQVLLIASGFFMCQIVFVPYVAGHSRVGLRCCVSELVEV